MKHDIQVWLSDMQVAISEIEDFISDHESFESFKNELKTKRAIERNIEIIGEALNRILKEKPGIQISNSVRL